MLAWIRWYQRQSIACNTIVPELVIT